MSLTSIIVHLINFQGNQPGLCPTCTLVVVTSTRPSKQVEGWYHYPNEKIIAQLLDVLDDVKRKGRQGNATIVMSFSYDWPHRISPMVSIAFRNLLQKLDELDVVLVASANNHAVDDPAYRGAPPREGMPVRRYPAKFADPNDQYGGLPNIIMVAATDMNALRVEESNFSPFVAAFAPGAGLHCPAGPSSGMEESLRWPTTSARCPLAGSPELDKLSNVKNLIQLYARYFRAMGSNVDAKKLRPVIWNGQIREHSCIREAGSTEDWAKTCPNTQDNLEDESTNPDERRQSGSSRSCPNFPGTRALGSR
ncbi:hypothetical protein N7519_000308 [Penicillium mononematosum]|uniref:uncharacterized protein n=1 Tax=Penicillium mononematosum TaxID=268346 RepID=UPI00254760EC|nr:uncharacterized protein N7519_000308 [Penicillium mononematosum]KAJ6190287.1 hypothetical protein N7519_000308 [Penicillium mononematosum]